MAREKERLLTICCHGEIIGKRQQERYRNPEAKTRRNKGLQWDDRDRAAATAAPSLSLSHSLDSLSHLEQGSTSAQRTKHTKVLQLRKEKQNCCEWEEKLKKVQTIDPSSVGTKSAADSSSISTRCWIVTVVCFNEVCVLGNKRSLNKHTLCHQRGCHIDRLSLKERRTYCLNFVSLRLQTTDTLGGLKNEKRENDDKVDVAREGRWNDKVAAAKEKGHDNRICHCDSEECYKEQVSRDMMVSPLLSLLDT